MLFEYADADGDGSLALIEFIELVRQMRSLVCTTELFYFSITSRLNVFDFSKLGNQQGNKTNPPPLQASGVRMTE